MNGFGFIEYDDPQDARDVVPGTFSFGGKASALIKDVDISDIAFRTYNCLRTHSNNRLIDDACYFKMERT